MTASAIAEFYRQTLCAKRGRGILAVHPYPTKIDPSAIAKCVLTHTRAGDTVVDCFSGSGTTGLAALMCDRSQGANAGPRNCHLFDVSGLATFIAKNSTAKVDVGLVEKEAQAILARLRRDLGPIYQATDTAGELGEIRYIVWSEVVRCAACEGRAPVYDLAVRTKPARILRETACPSCGHGIDLATAPRLTCRIKDDLLGEIIEQRMRVPIMLYGATGSRCWRRRVSDADTALISRVSRMSIPDRVPIAPLGKDGQAWGEMHRAGYHTGITHVHHFYSRRSLIALARAFELAEASDKRVRDALRLWVSSYNQAHMTLMTRVVAKKGHDDLTVTSGQSGVLYVSSLPVEKNLIRGLESKLVDLVSALGETSSSRSRVFVHKASGHKTGLKDASVDYVFTDPPFGDYIQYSEINRITEAWLGISTDTRSEAIVSRFAGKSIDFYRDMLGKVFGEMARILKPTGHMTLVFHSASPEIWAAVKSAWESAGFRFVLASILDKKQDSFKQVVSPNAVQGDALILLVKRTGRGAVPKKVDIWAFVRKYLKSYPSHSASKSTPRHLFGRVVAHCLSNGQAVPLSAGDFYSQLRERYPRLNPR